MSRRVNALAWPLRISFVVTALGSVTSTAEAWEVAAPYPVVTRVRERPPGPFPFNGTYFKNRAANIRDQYFFYTDEHESAIKLHSSKNGQRYGVRYLHQAFDSSSGSKLAPTLMRCAREPLDGELEKYGCEPWAVDTAVGYPWVEVRKSWIDNNPEHAGKEHDEHAALARRAAQIAGLPASLGKTFWLRYPAPNERIATPVGDKWIVGPKWKPLDMASSSSSTLRAVTLYELVQIPDKAYSVWSWASGNEECALDLAAPGFPNSVGDPGNYRCNDYFSSIALVNGTHMVPASKSIHHHYHQLALNRMSECSTLAVGLDGFDAYKTDVNEEDIKGSWTPVWSSNDHEVHQCEREAMVYEMFAQHFLQDAFATGHMWHRWGYPEPAMYPYRINDSGGIAWDKQPQDVPIENTYGRRAYIASVVGGFVGMIHGTKAVAERKVPPWVTEYTTLVDDPLNGPWYLDSSGERHQVKYQDANGFVTAGAGDLFAHLVLQQSGADYEPWQSRFLSCSAASMREVYAAGPKAHGELGAYQGSLDLDDAQLDMDVECWSQRATNSSMLGSVMPAPLAYAVGGSTPGWPVPNVPTLVAPPVFGYANSLIIEQLDKAPAMPNVEDRLEFTAALEKRMVLDQMGVVFDYLANVTLDKLTNLPFGPLGNLDSTESAEGRRIASLSDNLISFLGVEPNKELPASPPVSFMDVADAPSAADDKPQYHYLRNMFWRAHPEDTCEVPNLAVMLRDQCIAGAEEPGGDPEACTRCVDVASLQVPHCGFKILPDVGVSKCTALGYANNGGVDPRYSGRSCSVEMHLGGLPAYHVAFHYCTGTEPVLIREGQLVGERLLSRSQAVPIRCDTYPEHDGFFEPATQPHFEQIEYRYGLVLNENALQENRETGADGDPWSFVPPLVTAVVDKRTSTMLNERLFCGYERSWDEYYLFSTREDSSLDPQLQALIAPLMLWDDASKGMRALQGFERHNPSKMLFEQCGVTQRASYHNRDCATAIDSLGWDEPNGLELDEAGNASETRCSVVEPATARTTCGAGACNANGLCTMHPPAPVVIFHPK